MRIGSLRVVCGSFERDMGLLLFFGMYPFLVGSEGNQRKTHHFSEQFNIIDPFRNHIVFVAFL